MAEEQQKTLVIEIPLLDISEDEADAFIEELKEAGGINVEVVRQDADEDGVPTRRGELGLLQSFSISQDALHVTAKIVSEQL